MPNLYLFLPPEPKTESPSSWMYLKNQSLHGSDPFAQIDLPPKFYHYKEPQFGATCLPHLCSTQSLADYR
jgi:hypothetical protein